VYKSIPTCFFPGKNFTLLLFAAGMLFVSSQSAFAQCDNTTLTRCLRNAPAENCGEGTAFTNTVGKYPAIRTVRVGISATPTAARPTRQKLKQPSHTIPSPGTYTVSVKVFVNGTEDPRWVAAARYGGRHSEFNIMADGQDINLGPQEEEVCLQT
jgi:hypothetical protein